jgi:hypothetical protein
MFDDPALARLGKHRVRHPREAAALIERLRSSAEG